MGLHPAEIEFNQGVPSFQTIRQQYKQQTGLNIELAATVHLATGEFGALLDDASMLLPTLQANAAAVHAIDEHYKAEMAPFISTGHFWKASTVRERQAEAKEQLNYISRIEVVVDYGNFYPIEVYVHGEVIAVNMYYNQHYAVASLIKSLVALGGIYRWAGKEQTLPQSWRKLKQWKDYKWYNRPRR